MPNQEPELRLCAALDRLLAKRTWREVTLASVARAAGIGWTELVAIAPSKEAVVGLMLSRDAAETARRYKPERNSHSARERAFDVCMTWFDVQLTRKAAMRRFYRGLLRDPLLLLSARQHVIATAEWLLALAEADAGASAPLQAAGVAGALVRAIAVWLDDDEDMAKTMARLDRDLRRLEPILWPSRKQARATSAKGAADENAVTPAGEPQRAGRRGGSRRASARRHGRAQYRAR
ncbi:MAG: hypothetical protein ACREHV_06245 [Rhizomicrobium sp.]